MRRVRRGREAFLAGALLVWALSVLNSLHMLVHSTKRECILYYVCYCSMGVGEEGWPKSRHIM